MDGNDLVKEVSIFNTSSMSSWHSYIYFFEHWWLFYYVSLRILWMYPYKKNRHQVHFNCKFHIERIKRHSISNSANYVRQLLLVHNTCSIFPFGKYALFSAIKVQKLTNPVGRKWDRMSPILPIDTVLRSDCSPIILTDPENINRFVINN